VTVAERPETKSIIVTQAVQDYAVAHSSSPPDDVQRSLIEATHALGGISMMQISPDQGAFMTLLGRLIGAREAIELGTFTGYSAICIARGLAPGGRLIACELSEEYAEVAAGNVSAAGVADRVEIRIGPALDTLADIPERETFDLAFIDADKENYPAYYELVLARTRPGGLIVVDNVLAAGRVVDPDNDQEQVRAIHQTNELIAADERVDAAMVAIADGLMLARKR
jgi:caffeoyl-CoA O-methyltransferase